MNLLQWIGILMTLLGIAWTLFGGLVPEPGQGYVAGGSVVIIAFGLFLVVMSTFMD
ncbi:MAG: hypothetical protein SVW02_01665 [Candidatus Nanohaloarchaea archaeon]|nr:hypothetical protein [Candidatus Nanohaloarchaea archaeon]